jgi:hypothetical protein
MVGVMDLSSVGYSPGDNGGDDRNFTPFTTPSPWTDSLDDTSHVYIPPTGLVNVEVSGGDAHLKAGENEGWIASEVITCPDGFRYDLVYIEVDTPGNSYVEISMLNASTSPSEIGFANETIGGFKLKRATDLSIYSIGPKVFPEIRIQVTLHASGTDMPRLLSWTLYYIGLEEWRDDFLGRAKMERDSGLNISNGVVEINLSRRSVTTLASNYKAYPPVFFPWGGGSDYSTVFYPNNDRDGYESQAQFPHRGLGDAAFFDLNNDGFLDMVCANMGYGGSPIDSQIFWGTETGRWTSTGATAIRGGRANAVSLGDFNGDGEMDIAFASTGTESVGSQVFLNKGNGAFNYDPDITYGTVFSYSLDTGDVNNDGYDDILFYNTADRYDLYFGGPDGPDSTADITFPGGSWADEPLIEDVNGDEYLDVALAVATGGKVPIYLGGEKGPDTTADIELALPSWCARVVLGDVNGDGYEDFVTYGGASPYMIRIFKGGSDGWSNSRTHDISHGASYTYTLEVLDIDLNGYDDIIIGSPAGNFEVFPGGGTWPTSPEISLSGSSTSLIAIAVPETGPTGYGGTIVTKAITVPQGKKWDILNIEGSVPQNTSMRVDVLNDRKVPISGYDKLTDWNVDLSGIDPKFYRTISVRVSISSEFNNTTPILDSILVKWQDEGTWRDEFYGAAKVTRMLNLEVADMRLRTSDLGGAGPFEVMTTTRRHPSPTRMPVVLITHPNLPWTSTQGAHRRWK